MNAERAKNHTAVMLRHFTVMHRQGRQCRDIVSDVGLRVASGECFGLSGPSGSGKTALLWALAGLNPYWSGQMTLLGRSMAPGRAFTGELRHQVQMVFQDAYASLHPRHNVRRALTEPLRRRHQTHLDERIAQGIAQVGLSPAVLARYPHQLSDGQRQCVALIRALLQEPALLLLDDPTYTLDMASQARVLNLLNVWRREASLTIMLVSHDKDVMAHMCDRSAVMMEGRLLSGG
ncbi:ABC transporter ATP-binding protein [Musicola paradisiaca]|uniref:Glutathione import ATP-binding protein GsiA n=1 Tax=Musicola paradisiaca (strain Ech703) TaxID=579405 RepID=C6C4I4_MUSP7|nr:ATP-binding cassette domain-containing protein [Musicola paradisiaca]ACS85558.1 ABC transporter related [Musicola paradisiaca Ech703]